MSEMKEMNKNDSLGGGWKLVWDAFQALMIGMALQVNLHVASWNNYTNWYVSMQGGTMAATAAAMLAFAALRFAHHRLAPAGGKVWAASIFLGAWQVAAASVRNTGEIYQPFASSGQVLKSLVLALGMTFLFVLFFRLLETALDGSLDIRGKAEGMFVRLYRRHTLFFCAAVTFLCWLPHLVISFPCEINADTESQILQAMGLKTLNGDNPFLGTLLLWAGLKIGEWTGNGNFGLFLLVLIQAGLGALIIGYSQQIMRRLGAPRWLRGVTLAGCGLLTVYADNITVLLKDVPYVYAALLLLCELVRRTLLDDETYRRSVGHLVRMVAAGFVLLKIRNNGALILAPVAAVLLVQAWKNRKKISLGHTAAAVLLPFLLGTLFEMGVSTIIEPEPASLREALSMPFQQTARYVRDHEDEITPEEREIIEGVVDFSGMAHMYNPIISDPIKGTYRDDVQPKQLMRFAGLWAKNLIRDPLCYLEAVVVQNALMFDMHADNVCIFAGGEFPQEIKEQLNVHRPEQLEGLETLEDRVRMLLLGTPIFMQLNMMGVYCIILLGLTAIISKRKLHGLWLLIYPQLGTMIFLFFGPCLQNQDRYGFPIIYLMPLMLACVSWALQKNQQKQ